MPLIAAAACAASFTTVAQWEGAAPAWVVSFSHVPYGQQRPDFVRMATDRKLDVAEWLPLRPGSADRRWRTWYTELGDEAIRPLVARLREEHDERGIGSLLEIAGEIARLRPEWRPTPLQRSELMRAADSLCDPSRRARALEVLQLALR
jgi:hypothetical protein